MVRWLVLGSWLIVACRFDPRAAQPDAADVDAAEPDADLGLCTPAAKRCDGRVREVCGDDQRWDPEQATTCAFTCARGECVADSNVPIESVAACAADAPRFAPAAGTKIDLGVTGGVHLICTPDCGDPGVTRIDASGALIAGDRRFAWFCLSSIAMPDGASFAPASVGEALPAIAFVVDGDVDIAGTIDFSGALATAAVPGGRGGPGGFDGADRSDGSGNTGRGPCPGLGGANSGSGNHWIGGGGGGGGHATAGGPGGAGRCSNNDHNAAGRPGGEVCGGETLIPLLDEGGGGSGGDGATSVQQGWGGGGGGGAIQISSRTRITIAPTGALLGPAATGSATRCSTAAAAAARAARSCSRRRRSWCRARCASTAARAALGRRPRRDRRVGRQRAEPRPHVPGERPGRQRRRRRGRPHPPQRRRRDLPGDRVARGVVLGRRARRRGAAAGAVSRARPAPRHKVSRNATRSARCSGDRCVPARCPGTGPIARAPR